MRCRPLNSRLLALVVARVEDEIERHLEDLGDLEGIGLEPDRAARTSPTTGVTSKPVPVT